ncbi:MAG: glycosyltransferase [Alphaproteobacteria bacterium]|nr:glycosyltransferase [Alphaproteobacteria bacterium]
MHGRATTLRLMAERSPPIQFVVPGSIEQRTGGYGYDRRIISELRTYGRDVRVVELEGIFPNCDEIAKSAAARALSAVPEGSTMVIDGLALPAFEEVLEENAGGGFVIALVHHPLALETGLAASDSKSLSTLEFALLQQVDHIVTTSLATARLLEADGIAEHRISAVPPGTDRAPPTRGSSGGPLQLLCVAALIPRKGHRALIDALAECADPSWRLLCLGSQVRDRTESEAIAAHVDRLELSDKVIFGGEADEATLAAAYGAADVFVLASALEGYGMAFAEALARGLPIVGSGAGAVRDTVPGTAGLIVPVGAHAALVDALSRMIGDGALRARFAAGARAVARGLPDWPTAGREFVQVLDRAMAL